MLPGHGLVQRAHIQRPGRGSVAVESKACESPRSLTPGCEALPEAFTLRRLVLHLTRGLWNKNILADSDVNQIRKSSRAVVDHTF